MDYITGEIRNISLGTNRAQESSTRCLDQIQVAMNDFKEIASAATQLDEKSQTVSKVI